MVSIANAIMFYGFMKYARRGTYPFGMFFLLGAIADVAIAVIILAGE